MCGGGGGGAPAAPVGSLPPVTQEQINQAVNLPEGFKAEVVPGFEGAEGSYRIVDPQGDVYSQSGSFGELLAGANTLSNISGSANVVYDPGSNQYISSVTGEVVTPEGLSEAPQLSKSGVIGGREVGIAGPGDDIPGITELAYGLAAEGIELPEQMLAGFNADQRQAFELARAGIGSYKPFLNRAEGLTEEGVGSLQQALSATQDLAGQIPGQVSTGQGALDRAAGRIEDFAGQGAGALTRGAGRVEDFAAQGAADARRAADASYLAGEQGRALAADVTARARGLSDPLERRLEDATTGAEGIAQLGMSKTDIASERARASTGTAQRALQDAAELGKLAALQGITQLEGTGTKFTPDQTQAFMNQYEDAAVQQALADIARQGEIQQQNVAFQAEQAGAFGGGRQAVARQGEIQQQNVAFQAEQAGAFGGGRQAVAEQELARNVLEQQGRTAAQMRAAGFESASDRAQQAFEQSQARQQNVAQLTGQLGQAGVGASAQAAQAAGQLGLSAEELAQRGALQGAQLGLSAEQFAAANAQSIAQTGLNIEQLAAQTGMNAQQLAGQMANQAGQLGLQAGQMQMAGAETAGQMGAQAGQMQMAGAQQAGNLGLQSANLGLSGIQAGLGAQQQAAGLGQGIAGLGQQMAGLGQLGQSMNLQDINTMSTIGQQQQAQEQAALDVAYQNQYQQAMQPYQQLAFLSDITTGAPSGQMTSATQPGPSVGSQLMGAGLGIYGLSQSGMFG